MDNCNGSYPYQVLTTEPTTCVSICPETEKYIGKNNICSTTCPNYISDLTCTDDCDN